MCCCSVHGNTLAKILIFEHVTQVSVKRMGRWIDFKNDYKTLYPWFMETVWYVFKHIFSQVV